MITYRTVKSHELTDDTSTPKRTLASYLQNKGDPQWTKRLDKIVDRVILINVELRAQAQADALNNLNRSD